MYMRNYLKTPARTAAVFSFISGTVTHFFGLVNVLHNYDDIAQQPKGYGTGITSGRWFLSVLGDTMDRLGGNYNLPWVNGLLFLLLISLSAAVLVKAFQIENKKSAALVGMLFAVFPSTFSTLVFRYTSVYYGIGILLSVSAAWVIEKYRWSYLLSAMFTALSLGIYQAYVPITIGMFVLMLLQMGLKGEMNLFSLILRGIKYCVALILGLLFYYILLEVFLRIYGTQLSDYQGMDQMGKISLSRIPELLKYAVYSVIMMPVKDYCGITSMAIIKISYILLGVVTAVQAGFLAFVKIKKWDIVLFSALMFLLLPVAVNFIVIMCPDSWIYTLMVYSFILIPCVPIILFECILESEKMELLRHGMGIVLSLLICSYAYQTNVNYTALYYSNRQIENYFNSMITQIRMTDGFRTDMEWVFVGEIEDPLLHCYWQYEMSYGGIEFTEWMLRRYSASEWIRNYCGYSYPEPSEERVEILSNSEVVKKMPCWPNDGSISVIDGAIVIKCE